MDFGWEWGTHKGWGGVVWCVCVWEGGAGAYPHAALGTTEV